MTETEAALPILNLPTTFYESSSLCEAALRELQNREEKQRRACDL